VYPLPGTKISANDFLVIEQKMQEIAEKNLPVVKKVVSRAEAIQYFESLGEKFKVEIVNSLPQGEDIKIYGMGNWNDLCRGPHVPSTGKLGAFKLMSIAGAYWRANKDNEQLVRIYGTAWANKKDLVNERCGARRGVLFSKRGKTLCSVAKLYPYKMA
jgi:threonyl-tRNA synthetase